MTESARWSVDSLLDVCSPTVSGRLTLLAGEEQPPLKLLAGEEQPPLKLLVGED